MLTESIRQTLISQALKARQRAYAPYSHYLVGAALLTRKGEIVLGCNIENSSYGLTCCAERVAVFNAISDHQRNFSAIAIVTKDGGFPCGACRQVLSEFNPQLTVILANDQGTLLHEMTLDQLFPEPFKLES